MDYELPINRIQPPKEKNKLQKRFSQLKPYFSNYFNRIKKYFDGYAFSIFLISIFFRLICYYQYRYSPFYNFPVLKTQFLLEWVDRLLTGQWIGFTIFPDNPFQPYFLYLISIQKKFWLYLVQIFIGSLTGVIFYWVVKRKTGKFPAFVTGIIIGLYRPFLWEDLSLFSSSMEWIVFFFLLFSLEKSQEKWKKHYWFSSGMLAGLLITINFFTVIFPFWILIWMIYLSRRNFQKLKFILWFLAGLMLVFSGLLFHNALAERDVLSINSSHSKEFYAGNSEHSRGINEILPGIRSFNVFQMENKWKVKQTRDYVVNRYKQGLREIRKQGWTFFNKLWNKFVLFFHPSQIRPGFAPDYLLTWCSGAYFLPGGFLWILIPGCVGLYSLQKDLILWGGAGILWCLTALLYSIDFSWRIIPLGILFCGFAEFIKIALKQWKNNKKIILIFLIFCLIVDFCLLKLFFYQYYNPDNHAYPDLLTGNIFLKKNQLGEARKYIVKALNQAPGEPDIWNTLGMIEEKRNQFRIAVTCYETGLKLASSYPPLLLNLGVLKYRMKKFAQSEIILRKLVNRDPYNGIYWLNFAVLLQAKGEFDNALRAFQKALYYKAPAQAVWNNLGDLFSQKRKFYLNKNKIAETLYNSQSGNPVFLENYIRSLMDCGAIIQAREILENQKHRDKKYLLNLIRIYRLTGEKEKLQKAILKYLQESNNMNHKIQLISILYKSIIQ